MSDERAQQAARLWGFDPGGVTLAARRENVVYRVEADSGTYALRLHRPGYRSAAELESELHWMAALEHGGMAVPRPVPLPDGQMTVLLGDTLVDMLTWLPGQPLGAQGAMDGVTDRPALAHRLGRLLAQMHDLSDGWTPPPGFTRPSWDRAGLLGDDPLWGRFWEHPDLTPDQRALFEAARAQAKAHLAGIESELDHGLIHADVITENIMRDGNALYLIDFDDGGWGFRDFELATFLMRFVDAPDHAEIRAALLEGYSIRRRIDTKTLDLFLTLRALTYPGWIIPRRHEPCGAARSARAIATAVPLAETYLNGGPK
ncbi:phosphotransferase [Lacimonas salitolerans]|uniref:Phosphotransferase n=1 Tax=Lacimonas salitolerans TaxID=1323750 RepID=A0ABW4EG48_9RHOB